MNREGEEEREVERWRRGEGRMKGERGGGLTVIPISLCPWTKSSDAFSLL